MKPLKQPVCHAFFHARAGPVFRAFLEEKFLLESFWPAKKPILSLLIPIPELGSTFAGTGTLLRIDARGARLACEADRRDNKGVQSLVGRGSRTVSALFHGRRRQLSWRIFSRSARRAGVGVHDGCCHALPRGSAAFRPFPHDRPDKFMRLARPVRKFRSLAYQLGADSAISISALSLVPGWPDVAPGV